MDIIKTINNEIKAIERPINFEIGDTVRVHYRIIEGERERVQIFEGIVIAMNNSGNSASFTVRKISFDIGVERVFPLLSPRIAKVEVIRKGKAKRSKLYFLRERTGKSAKLKEKRAKGKDKINKDSNQESEPVASETEVSENTEEKSE